MIINFNLKKVIRPLVLVIGCLPLIYGTSLIESPNGSLSDSEMETLRKLNARFINNFITNDTVSHSQIIHKSFNCITSKGLRLNRKDYLTGWAHGYNAEAMPYFDYRDERISLYGTTALVRSVTKYVSIKDGKETSGMTMYTDTYIKEGGEWKCVQAQLTSVAPENYPSDETIVHSYKKGVLQ